MGIKVNGYPGALCRPVLICLIGMMLQWAICRACSPLASARDRVPQTRPPQTAATSHQITTSSEVEPYVFSLIDSVPGAMADGDPTKLVNAVNYLWHCQQPQAIDLMRQYALSRNDCGSEYAIEIIVRTLFEVPVGQLPPEPWFDQNADAWRGPMSEAYLIVEMDIPFTPFGIVPQGKVVRSYQLIEWASRHGVMRERPLEPGPDVRKAGVTARDKFLKQGADALLGIERDKARETIQRHFEKQIGAIGRPDCFLSVAEITSSRSALNTAVRRFPRDIFIQGDGLQEHRTIELFEDGSAMLWNGPDRGSWNRFEIVNGRVVVLSTHEKDKPTLELTGVKWGARTYLIPPVEIDRFHEQCRTGVEPRRSPNGEYYLRYGDHRLNVRGEPTNAITLRYGKLSTPQNK